MTSVDSLWYTRCPVPAASGVAFQLGWLTEAFADEGITVQALQDAPPELARHHFDHELLGLFREGGSVPAFAARSEGARTRVIGLTWIEEGQSIVARPDSGIRSSHDLAGRTIGIPAWSDTRATSFPRAMGIHGFEQVLGTAGLTLDDVRIVEFENELSSLLNPRSGQPSDVFGVDAVVDGRVDAVYGKGAAFAEQAARAGLVVAVDLDALPERRFRINNGTPRPITVHERLLEERPDIVVRFLVASLRASDWAAEHPDELRGIVARETLSGASGIDAVHADDFHRHLHPDLSDERVELFAVQQQFLQVHGFLQQNFALDDWIAREPLDEARALLSAASATAA